MKKRGKYVVLIISSILIFMAILTVNEIYFSNDLVGKLPVKGIDDVYFKIYQQNTFDSATPVGYEIVNNTNGIVSERHHLTGSRNEIDDLDIFSASSYDSIVFLTVWDSNEIYVVFDLKSGLGYPRGKSLNEDYKSIRNRGDSLVKVLNSYNKELFRHGTRP